MNKQTILLLILVLTLAAIGYIWFGYLGNKVSEVKNEKSEKVFADRLSQLRRLKNLRLDVSLLQDPLFKTLKTPEIKLESLQTTIKQGRENPFLPF